jgi:hypothetical protein
VTEGGQTGATDLLLGLRFGLTKQQQWLPESSIIVQASVPTGTPFLTQKEVMPGIIAIVGWEVIKSRLSVSGSLSANRALDGADHVYTQVAESLAAFLSLTKQLDFFTEFYGIAPVGALDPTAAPQPFFDTGFTYRLTPNLQLDAIAGLGLNHHTDQFYVGGGLSVRY